MEPLPYMIEHVPNVINHSNDEKNVTHAHIADVFLRGIEADKCADLRRLQNHWVSIGKGTLHDSPFSEDPGNSRSAPCFPASTVSPLCLQRCPSPHPPAVESSTGLAFACGCEAERCGGQETSLHPCWSRPRFPRHFASPLGSRPTHLWPSLTLVRSGLLNTTQQAGDRDTPAIPGV